MARTIQEISSAIKESFTSNVTLRDIYDLDSSKTFDEQFSIVSLEAILIFLFASSVWLLEQLWDSFSKLVEQRIDNAYVTSIAWYYKKALEFQKGDNLIFNEQTYSFGYQFADESKQIVKNVAVRQVTDNEVTKLKIYFSDIDKQPLTGDTRTAFESYIREIGAAGTHYLFISEQPDPIRIHLHIYYNPLVLDSSGVRLSGGDKPVEEAIQSYIDNIEYGGIFYSSALIDIIQSTEGVKDVVLDGTTWQGTLEQRRKIDSQSGAFVYLKENEDITYLID